MRNNIRVSYFLFIFISFPIVSTKQKNEISDFHRPNFL